MATRLDNTALNLIIGLTCDLFYFFQFKYPICGAIHLRNKTEEYKEKLVSANLIEDWKEVEEYGLTRIREILSGFQTFGTGSKVFPIFIC
jgi:hypothetical protein